jgi:T5SS/PEP-CTERM-associated repeat protein
MGFNHFYEDAGVVPTFTLSDLANYTGSVSEMVLNVTWAELEPTSGKFDFDAISSAISAVSAYNTSNGTDLGIKLRVWGGVVAPDWAKNIDGPPIVFSGQATVDPTNYTPRTIGHVWTADYNEAWTELQDELATYVTSGGSVTFDGNPIIRGISQTAGATASDEPFVSLPTDAPVSKGATDTVNQFGALVSGGYSNEAEMLTLRAAIADYAAWATTPLDYSINPFHIYENGSSTLDQNFSLAVLQETRNSTRLVQAGNHALDNPQHSQLPYLYAQLTADAALTTAAAPNSYQTASPDLLATHSGTNPDFTGDYSNWPNAIANGIAANGGNIELWDFSGPQDSDVNGFLGLTTGQMAELAAMVANGVAPVTEAPANGAALGFQAPAFITGPAGIIQFTGTGALLLASAAPQTSYSVTLTSLNGHTLTVIDNSGIVSGAASGTTIAFSGSLDQVNTVLASLTDTLASGTDVVQIAATDSGGDSASRNVGVRVVAAGSATSGSVDTPPSAFQANGVTVLAGVQASLGFAGDLQIGPSGYTTTLFAALAPSAYATATLSVGGTFEVKSGGAAYFTGDVSAATIEVDYGGLLNGAGVVSGSSAGAIVNSGTIEAIADLTIGLQQLEIGNAVTGSGTLLIDAAATLILDGAVGSGQVIEFGSNTSAQLSESPYPPSTLELAAPSTMSGPISGFTYADRLMLEGVTITSASYDGSTLTVDTSSGALTYSLAGDNLSGLTLDTSSATLSQGIIQFLPPASSTVPDSTTVDQIVVTGGTTVETDYVTANGIGGVAVSVDGGSTLALAGGAVVTANEAAIVGNTGQGTMVVMGGALTLAGSASPSLVIGAHSGASGAVVDLEQITGGGMIVVGSAGSGSLELRGVAATVSDGGAVIGQAATGSGSVLVNGGEWMNSGAITVGGAGVGTLTIDGSDNGITGQVTAYNVNIGNQANGQGVVELDNGEMLVANFTANENTLTVGGAGIGELDLQGGSEVAIGYAIANTASNTGRLIVGASAGGQGAITIADSGTILVYGDATVGSGGSGTVMVGENTGDQALLALLGTLSVGATGTVALGDADAAVRASTIDIASGGVLSGFGTLSGDLGGNQTVTTTDIENDGTIAAEGGGLLVYGNVTGSGTMSIASGATLTVEGSVDSGQTIDFASHATLVIDDPAAFSGTLSGFDTSDTLIIGGVRATDVSWSSGTLTVDLPSGSLHYAIAGDYSSGFTATANNVGGSTVEANPSTVGSGQGDVHMTTFDGLNYDFQAVGDFVVAQSTDAANPWEVQMRTVSWGGGASYTQELAADVGGDRVTFAVGRDSLVYVDGTADTGLQPGGVQTLDGGGTLAELANGSYRLTGQNGEQLTATNVFGAYLDWTLTLGPNDAPGSVRGLLGSDTGQANDFQLPDGTVLTPPLSEQQMLGTYADAWRVAPGASRLNDWQAPVVAQLVQAMAAPTVSSPAASTAASPSFQPNNDPLINVTLFLAPENGGGGGGGA